MFGHSPFSFLTFAESPVNAQVTLTGVEARGNQDLGGATHAEYFVPSDVDNPNLTVIAYEDSTTVYADGVSQGTITSAGGTLTITAANYEDKIISANKPITLQNTNNETVGVPTSWAGTSFGVRNTRTGVNLQMRALYGTASVEIFKDGVSTTTLSVGSTSTTTQFYADDTSDPEYTIYSDIPIMVFKSGNTGLFTDSRSLFPATTDFLYGIASGGATAVRVDGYGETGVSTTRHDSNGGSNTSGTITTAVSGLFAGGADFTGPTNRISAQKAIIAYSIADGDGAEKTTFVPAGCFANEFRLIEAAEFVCFMGEPGTNGRNIKVYNSSGTLVDTVQLATSNTGADYPTKFQLISSTTTDSNLTGNAKGYALTAGMRFVSEVPVGAIVEDDSQDNENNLFGLRYFGGFVSGAATVSLTGVVATGAIQPVATTGFEIDITEVLASVSATGSVGTVEAKTQEALGSVSATGSVNTVTVNILEALNSVSATGAVGTFTIANTAGATGVSGTTNTPAVQPNVTEILTGVSATGAVNSVVINRVALISGVGATGSVNTVEPKVTEILTGVGSTASLGNVTTNVLIPVTGVNATTFLGTVEAQSTESITGVSATGTVAAVQPNVLERVTSVSATGAINTVNISNSVALASVDASVATGSVQPNVTELLTGVSATGAVGTFTIANTVSLTGVSATGAIENVATTGFEIDISEVLESVSATSAVGTIQVNVAEVLASVSATVSANDVEVKATSTIAVDGVSATGSVNTLEEKPTEVLDSVSATISVNFGQVNVAAIISGVSATGAVGTLEDKPTEILESVSATGIIGNPLVRVIVTKIISGVAAVTSIGTFTISNTVTLTGVVGTTAAGQTTETGVIFDFGAVRDLYDRDRTVYVPRRSTSQEREAEVAVVPRTAYAARRTTSADRTVVVAAENRVVYIPRRSTSAERTAEAA